MGRSQGIALSRRSFFHILVLLAVFLGVAWQVNAQSTATLQGTVSDPTGAAVPGAKVVATNEATGVQSETVSDSAGAYLFPSLLIGNYKLEISAPGFKSVALAGLKLDVATAVTQNAQLKVGEATERIEIVADAPLIDTVTTSVGQVINDKTVQEIPLNGRHFTDLSLLTPGTVTPPANGFLSAPLRGQGSFGINTAGQREDTTNWLVNGINLSDPAQNQITFQPPIDTLAEYKIDNSSFPAEYGRNSGAIVNLATRSGTSEYHGEAFEFFRNNALDARNFFNTSAQGQQAPYKKNDFGADFGGPIVKNKIFFFAAYEGIRQHQNLTASTTVPSQNQRATVTSPAVNSLLALLPAANFHQAKDASTAAADFTGFTGGALANVSLDQGSGDLDIELRQQDRVHVYYVAQKDLRQEPLSPTVLDTIPGFGDTRDGFRQLLTVSEDHTFSASIANTVRIGYNRIHLTFLPNALLNPAAFNINLPAGVPVSSGLPDIQVAGTLFFGGPNAEPQGRGDTTAVLNDTLSWLKGRHSFAFGGEIRRAYNNNIAENVGTFAFTTFANFLNDHASSFTTQLGAGNDKLLQPAYDGFAQDTFKWKPNFTINLGLRYAWNSTPSEAAGHFTNFDTATGTLIPASQPYHTNNKNFQPRVGFAWDPFKDGKTSVRAAYAILTQDPTTNTVSGLSSNPPFALPIAGAPSATTPLTLENPSSGVAAPSLGPFAINPNFNDAYSQDWNLTIQRQLTSSLGVEAAYVGVKGTHLQINENINQPFVTNGVYGSTRPFAVLPQSSPVLPAQCVATTKNPIGCRLNNFNQVNSVGNSNYNALWIKADKHFSNGLQFLATYTFAKAMDYNSLSTAESLVVQNAYNPRGDYGLSEYDVRHRFVLSGFYELPFKSNRLVSGWQIGVVQQAQTGSPLTPSLTINPAASIPLTVRPDLIGTVQTTGNPSQYFASKAVFVSPCVPAVAPATLPTCHPGTLGRDSITGPGFVDTDFSITKNTKINERFNLQFRSEFFDIFNHPNFGNPVLTVTSSSFGQIQSTRFPTGDFGSARQIQFALKLMF